MGDDSYVLRSKRLQKPHEIYIKVKLKQLI